MQPMSFDPHQDPVDVHRDDVADHHYRDGQAISASRSVLPSLIGAAIIVVLIVILLVLTRAEPSTIPTSTIPDISTTVGI